MCVEKTSLATNTKQTTLVLPRSWVLGIGIVLGCPGNFIFLE